MNWYIGLLFAFAFIVILFSLRAALKYRGYWVIAAYDAVWNIDSDFGMYREKCLYEVMTNKNGRITLRTSGYKPKKHKMYPWVIERANKLRQNGNEGR